MKVIKFKSFAPMAEYLVLKDSRYVKDDIVPVLFTTNNCDTIEEAEKAITCWANEYNYMLTKVWVDIFETSVTDTDSITNKIGTIEYENKWVPKKGSIIP